MSIENIKKDGDDEMMETEKNCTRVVYTKGREVHTLLGLLLEENSIYVSLKTRKRVYKISQSSIIEISSTDELFDGGVC